MYNKKMETMTNFDVTKYVGTWYEAASIPKGYESGCTEAVAFYSQMETI